MVSKKSCDVCGVEIPCSIGASHNEAAKMYEGRFYYGAITADEFDDLCVDCGKLIRGCIRLLKKEFAETGKLPKKVWFEYAGDGAKETRRVEG